MSELERVLPLAGPWVIGGHRGLLFFSRGRAQSEWGRGTWRADGPRAVQLTLCAGGKSYALTFDSATAPSAFTYPRGGLLGSDLGKGESPICARRRHRCLFTATVVNRQGGARPAGSRAKLTPTPTLALTLLLPLTLPLPL